MVSTSGNSTVLEVIWVFENIQKSPSFYGKLDILLLLTSVSLWRRNHREDICVLYCDDMTYDILAKLKVVEFWHKVRPIPNQRRINKTVFWASSKLQVLSDVNEPTIILDHDTHVYKPLKPFLEMDKLYVTNLEKGENYYPNSTDLYVKQLSYKPRWQMDSVNVSFLNLPDANFTREYARLSLDLMEELTYLKAPNSQYLIFAEQLLLKQLLQEKSIPHKSIISTYWGCKKWDWTDNHQEGIWPIRDSYKFFKHYGPLKGKIKDSRDGENYAGELIHLLNCINMPNLDLSIIPKK